MLMFLHLSWRRALPQLLLCLLSGRIWLSDTMVFDTRTLRLGCVNVKVRP